jgi:hypothetical protein
MRPFHPGAIVLWMAVTAAILPAQARPNFSGEWTLVVEKSEFGPMPPPSSMQRTITHVDPSLRYVTVQRTAAGETKTEVEFSTDGKPQKNLVQGNTMVTTGRWDGHVIVLSSTLAIQDARVSMEERLALSDGGRTLTVTRSFTTPDGPATTKFVLTRK